jgi:predicted nucleic acid-binding protein
MNVLLDTKIVLDVLLNRIPWQAEAAGLLAATRQGRLLMAVTSLTIANVAYVARRRPRSEMIEVVRACLDSFDVLPLDRAVLQIALTLPGGDFEDNIQIAAATQAGLEGIVTRDASGYAESPIPIFTPSELLARVAES